MSDAQIIQEYYEAAQAVRIAVSGAIASHPEWESLPEDVRQAKAGQECLEEVERNKCALIAYEQMKAEREDRWISAHEYIKNLRTGYAQ